MSAEHKESQEVVTFKNLYEGLLSLVDTSKMEDSRKIERKNDSIRLVYKNEGLESSFTGFRYTTDQFNSNRLTTMFRLTKIVDLLISPTNYLYSPKVTIINNADYSEMTDPIGMKLVIASFINDARSALTNSGPSASK